MKMGNIIRNFDGWDYVAWIIISVILGVNIGLGVNWILKHNFADETEVAVLVEHHEVADDGVYSTHRKYLVKKCNIQVGKSVVRLQHAKDEFGKEHQEIILVDKKVLIDNAQ